MEENARPRGAERSGHRRSLRRAVWLSLLVLAASFLVPPVRNGVWGRLLLAGAGRFLASGGRELSVGSLGGSWLASLELSDVVYEGAEGDVLRSATVSSVRAEYSLLALLRGDLGALSVDGSGVRVTLGPAAPAETAPAEPAGASAWPARLPRVSLRDVTLEEVDAALGGLAVRGADLSVGDGDPRQALRLEVRELVPPEGTLEPAELVLRGAYEASSVAVEELTFGGERVLEDLDVRPGGTGRLLAWTGRVLPGAGGLAVEGALGEDGGLTLDLVAQQLDLPGTARRLEGLLPADLTGEVDLRVRVRGGGSEEAWTVDAEVTARELGLAGRTLDALTAEAALRGTTLTRGSVEASRGEDRLVVSDLGGELVGDLSELLRGLSGQLELSSRDLAYWTGADPADVPGHHAELGAVLAGGGASLTGSLEVGEGRLTVSEGRLELAQPGETLGDTRLELDLDARLPDFGEFVSVFGLRGAGSLDGTFEVDGTLSTPRAALVLHGLDMGIEGVALGEVEVLGALDAERLDVASLKADGPIGSLSARGLYELADGRLSGVDLELDVTDLRPLGLSEVAAGSLRLSGAAEGAVGGDLSASLDLEGTELDVAGVPLEGIRASGTWTAGSLTLRELAVRSGEQALDARGTLAPTDDPELPWALALEELELTAGGEALALREVARARFGAGRVEVASLELASAEQRLSVAGRLAPGPAGLEWSADVDLVARELAHALLPLVSPGAEVDALELTAHGAQDAGGLRVEATGALEALRLGAAAPVGGSWTLRAEDGRVFVEELELDSADGLELSLSGSVPLGGAAELFAPGALDLRGTFAVPDLRPFLALAELEGGAGRIDGELELAGSWRALSGRVELAVDGLEAQVPGLQKAVGPAQSRARLVLGEEVALEELSWSSPRGEFDGDGRIGTGVDVTALARGELPLSAPLALRGEARVADTAWIAPLLSGVRRFEGAVRADVEVGGTLAAPEPRGEAAWTGGSFKLEAALPAFERVEARLGVDPRSITVRELAGEMGGAPFSLSGSIDRHGAGPGRPTLELDLEGHDLLLHRRSGVKVRADVDLAVTGAVESLQAKGEVTLQESRFVKNLDFLDVVRGGRPPSTGSRGFSLFSFRQPPMRDLRFDVRVRSAQPFVIDNNLLWAELRPDLHLGGTGLSPELSGPVYVDSARVSLPSTVLFIRGGALTFDRETYLGPRVNLSGEARAQGYDVTVAVNGPYDDPEVRLSSSPPLPGDDLVVLLLSGRLPEQKGGTASVAQYLVQDAVLRWFDDESTEGGDSLGRRLEVYAGNDVTESGGETIEVSFRLSDIDQEGERYYLTGERDVYDRINYGFRVLFRFP